MPSYTELPITLINKYIWDLASGSVSGQPAVASAVWDTSLYTYRPFFPVHEMLAPDGTPTPYVIYDYMLGPSSGTFWPLQKEEADYIIVGEIPQIFYIRNYIIEALEKFDESARDINNHLQSNGFLTKFKYIYVEQEKFIAEERRQDNFKPKFITCLRICYEYTK